MNLQALPLLTCASFFGFRNWLVYSGAIFSFFSTSFYCPAITAGKWNSCGWLCCSGFVGSMILSLVLSTHILLMISDTIASTCNKLMFTSSGLPFPSESDMVLPSLSWDDDDGTFVRVGLLPYFSLTASWKWYIPFIHSEAPPKLWLLGFFKPTFLLFSLQPSYSLTQ